MANQGEKRSATWAARAVAAAGFLAISMAAGATETDAYPTVRESMIAMSRQLGVTCVYCHDVGNLKSAAKPTFAIAKRHMAIVQTLNGAQGFGGKPKADCFMCHRGETKYPYVQSKDGREAKP